MTAPTPAPRPDSTDGREGLAEPGRWSVVWTKSDDTTWLNVGRQYELDGSAWKWMWVSTHLPPRVSTWDEMDVAAILAVGLDEPITPDRPAPRSDAPTASEEGLAADEREYLIDRGMNLLGPAAQHRVFDAIERVIRDRNRVRDAAQRREAIEAVALKFQTGAWADVIPPALKTEGIVALSVGQAVTDWLRAHAEEQR